MITRARKHAVAAVQSHRNRDSLLVNFGGIDLVPRGAHFFVQIVSAGHDSISPLGVGLAAKIPHTKTNDRGEYRFEDLPWWGKYTVYADDAKAGYSSESTGTVGNSQTPEVEVTPEHPKAEYNLSLPPKAGFIQIHLTNRRTGVVISAMTIRVVPMDKPDAQLFHDPGVFTMSCYSDRVILVAPGENLLLHVKSDGFKEWDESVGKGKPLNVPSGGLLTLDVQLDHSN